MTQSEFSTEEAVVIEKISDTGSYYVKLTNGRILKAQIYGCSLPDVKINDVIKIVVWNYPTR